MYKYNKQEKPEMDDFERKKTLVLKENYLEKFLTDTLEKMSQNILHIFFLQNILSIFFYFEKKTCIF